MPLVLSNNLSGAATKSGFVDIQQTSLHVVIAENQAAQRAIARDLLIHEVFTGRNIEVHDAKDAVNARMIIDELIAEGHNVFCLLDLHMDETGKSPELNGDSLVEGLITDDVRIPVAIASGTISHKRARLLLEGLDGLTFLNKDAFSMEADPEERKLLAQRILKAAEQFDVTTITREQLGYLKLIVAEGMNVPKMHVLVDTIKSETRKILRFHSDELKMIDGGVALLEVHGLYDGDASLNIHEYKNSLQLFIQGVQSDSNPPTTLLEDLILLQSLINNTYRALVQCEEGIDIASVLRSLCDRLSKLSGKDISFRSKVQSFTVPGDPAAIHHLLSNVLHNALAHGTGKVDVEIQKNGVVRVWNATDTTLPFSILNGKIEGELPENSTSATGSATGIREMMRICNEQNFQFGICPYNDGVTTFFSTGVTPKTERMYFTDAPLREPTVPYGIVGFLSHDNEPQKTFEHNEFSCPQEFAIRYLNIQESFTKFLMGGEGGERFVELCKKYFDNVFSNMSICFVHGNIIICDRLTNALHKRYPQITFMPVSHEPGGMKKDASERFRSGKMMNPNIIHPSMLAALVKPEDPSTPDEVMSETYQTVYSASVFKTLIAIAHRRAFERTEDENKSL
jgi:signal transduction histidine kinase